MESFFEKNLAALKEKHAGLYKSLVPYIDQMKSDRTTTDGESFELVRTGKNSLPNLLYTRMHPEVRCVYHGDDPELEAQQVIQQADLAVPHLVFIFGMGLGYILNEFYKTRPSTNFYIVIVEKNPFIFLHALKVHDFTKALRDITVRWMILPDFNDVATELRVFIQEATTVSRNLKILGTPRAIQTEDQFYQDTAKSIMSLRDYITVIAGNSVSDTFLGMANTIENFDIILKNPGVAAFAGKFRGKTAISVAAGPSVNEHWDFIRSMQGKVPIIACDTLVKPMIDRGIKPDFYTAIERDHYVTTFFEGFPIDNHSTLIGPTVLLRESLDAYGGDIALYSPGIPVLDFMQTDHLHRMRTGSSAGNLNLDFAETCGFSNIIMIGHNLAYGYKSNETHLRGTIDPSREKSRTPEELKAEANGGMIATQDGLDEVPTRWEWNLYRTQIEGLIKASPNTKFISVTPKGARIEGAILMSIEEATALYCNEPFDIQPIKRELMTPPTEAVVESRRIKAYEGFQRAANAHKHWKPQAEKLIENLAKWELEIKAKEALGKRVSIEFLNKALDSLLSYKVKSTNFDPYYYSSVVAVLLPSFVAFEREINELPSKYTDNYNLKRDFLLKHKVIMDLWAKWFPKIESKVRWALDNTFADLKGRPVPSPVGQESLTWLQAGDCQG